MNTGAPGIKFHETLRGGFALGETDPYTGARAGEEAGTELVLYATVVVHHLDRFDDDPRHAGVLSGRIDFPPLGMEIPGENGVFRLSSPTGDPFARHIVYEIPFERNGELYYLAGHKEVRNEPGGDSWKGITTLLARLHRGSDTAGPIIGAGVLGLSITEFTRVLAGMRAQDVKSAAEGARLLARFGRLFAGDLWKSYIATVPK